MKVRVAAFSVSLDGFGAGVEQSLADPLGKGGMGLHHWAFGTRSFHRMHGGDDSAGSVGVDDDYMVAGFANLGAWILGRNMFGPVRGPWPDETWKGWWGANPPYHVPVFVLTHHPRASLEMEGGTVFHFVTDGLDAALERAREAAAGGDVRIGGGVATVRAALQARALDELHLAYAPVLLGRGESLLGGLDLPALGYTVRSHETSASAMHVIIDRDQRD
jgi:dihydrofolate reductase